MGVRIILDGPCEMAGAIDMPGYPPTLIAVTGGEKNDVLDQLGDAPRDGEVVHLYVFEGKAFLDFRERGNRQRDGEYGSYRVVPAGRYVCLDCGADVVSPPSWPFERCTHWGSGFHRIDVRALSVIEAPEATDEALGHIAEMRGERGGVGLYGERDV